MANGSEYEVSIVTEMKKGWPESTARSTACLKNGSRSVASSQKDGAVSVSSGFIGFKFAFARIDWIVPPWVKRVTSTDSSEGHVKSLE